MATPPISTLPRANNPFAPRRYGELHPVTDGVYVFRNITNSSFVIGDRSVAVIDTQVNASLAAELLRHVRSVTTKPIEFVINTHYHWDHTNGNALFKKEGATIISSKLTKDFMVTRAARQKEFLSGRGFELGQDPLLPDKTFENEFEIDLGNMPLRLFFAGSAETDDATAVHVPKKNVLMSGDTVMTGSFPIFGQPVWDEGLQDEQWQKTIQKLLSLKPSPIIPGHGPLAREKEIDLLIRIQKYFLEEVGIMVKKGMDINAILLDLEPRLPGWITEIPVVWGSPRYAILRVYRGLTKKTVDREVGWQQCKPSAIPNVANVADRPGKSFQECLQMAHEAEEGGDIGLKIFLLNRTIEFYPDSPDALALYAQALVDASRSEASVLEKGDFFSRARSAWKKALEINPFHVPTLLGQGRYLTMMAYRGGDDPSEGMAFLKQALDLAQETRQKAEAEFYLGMGFRRLGNEPKAKAQFQKALLLDPGFHPAVMANQS